MSFDSLEQMLVESFDSVRPTRRMRVTEAAKEFHVVRSPGAHSGPWSEARTPYLVEPQDTLTSLEHTAMAFVGPARTGKSMMFLNWVAHTAETDPADMMVVHMARHTARDWSKSDLDKMLRHSPSIREKLRPGRANDNTFDKEFMAGWRLTVTWPTITNLSGKTIPRNWIMDYDRIDDDIDKEGNAFDLTRKRAATFKRFGMTAVESSPGRPVENPKWIRKTPHEAPPTKGILEIYNRGDRRRWYWQCPSCAETFEPVFDLFHYPDSADEMEAAEQVTMMCPHCGTCIGPDQKDELNSHGKWVKDGMVWLPDGKVVTRPGMRAARSDIASFWLKGPAAGFQDWSSIVLNYLRAERTYEATQDEKPLQTTVNVDQGEPYTPKARISERLPEDLKDKVEFWGSEPDAPTVPAGVRFLIATVDVQKRSFVVQVQGFTADGDMVIIDAFKIRKSARLDEDGHPSTVDPSSYGEDWDLITTQVMLKSYALGDNSGRRMAIRLTGCDSGGRENVTFNAYDYWRRLRNAGDGLHRRLALIKGDGARTAPRATVSWPDAGQRDKLTAARGDVPVVRMNSDLLKDQVAAMLSRRVAEDGESTGGGMIRYPAWMPDWFYTQMTTEVRLEKGWDNPGKRRNESFDLAYYAIGLAVRPKDRRCPLAHIGFDRMQFENPPIWAEEWDENELVFGEAAEPESEKHDNRGRKSFADLARDLA